LQIGLATTDPVRVRRVRDELLRNNDRCTALINGLLTLARGEQGRRGREEVAFDDVVRQIAREAATEHRSDQPGLRLDVPGRCTVSGDRLLLAQLVRNLMDNALRYNVPGGEVLVRLAPNGHLTISNTGPAISADEAARLFEPFYRGAERTGQTDGTGLGLSIVRAVAAAYGGNGPPLAGYGAVTMSRALAATITTLPQQLWRSLTWDRGKELSAHAGFTVETGVPVFFADPHSPWQRGTNENTNGLLRQYFPKGTDLSRWTAEEINAIAHALNSRPRKHSAGGLPPKPSTNIYDLFNRPVLRRPVESESRHPDRCSPGGHGAGLIC
jgi:hypothetical protein